MTPSEPTNPVSPSIEFSELPLHELIPLTLDQMSPDQITALLKTLQELETVPGSLKRKIQSESVELTTGTKSRTHKKLLSSLA